MRAPPNSAADQVAIIAARCLARCRAMASIVAAADLARDRSEAAAEDPRAGRLPPAAARRRVAVATRSEATAKQVVKNETRGRSQAGKDQVFQQREKCDFDVEKVNAMLQELG